MNRDDFIIVVVQALLLYSSFSSMGKRTRELYQYSLTTIY